MRAGGGSDGWRREGRSEPFLERLGWRGRLRKRERWVGSERCDRDGQMYRAERLGVDVHRVDKVRSR